jgi:hypothetical protein
MVHFLLTGIAIFAVHRAMTSGDSIGTRIIITQDIVDDLVTQHTSARGRPPSPAELRHLIDGYVREEIVYREGVALGLDRDDIVVKRRIRQKLEVMVEEEAATAPPTDADLAAYMAANPERFRKPSVMTFEQAFLGPVTARQAVQRVLVATGGRVSPGFNPVGLGRPTLLPPGMTRTESDLIAHSFGVAFVSALEQAPLGKWTGPIESEYGAHYVRVSARTPSVMPQLSEVRSHVVREWENDRRRRARDENYSRMRRKYEVSIEAAMPVQMP